MQEETSIPFPTLTTPRLVLRQLKITDAKTIAELRSNESVNRFLDRAKQTSFEQAKAFIQAINNSIRAKKSLYWAICQKADSQLIGTISLWNFSADKTIAEIGYELNPMYQGQGFMNEALTSVIHYIFTNLPIKTLEAFTHKDNSSSIQLLLKNNFQLDPNRKDEENENNRIYRFTAFK